MNEKYLKYSEGLFCIRKKRVSPPAPNPPPCLEPADDQFTD